MLDRSRRGARRSSGACAAFAGMVWELGGAVGRRIRGMSKPAQASPAASGAQQMTPLELSEGCGNLRSRRLRMEVGGEQHAGEAIAASHAAWWVATGERGQCKGHKLRKRTAQRKTVLYRNDSVAKERTRAGRGDGVVQVHGTFSTTDHEMTRRVSAGPRRNTRCPSTCHH